MSKHPADRQVFFTSQGNDFLSLNVIRQLTQSGKLSAFDVVFDVDGNSYTAKNIAEGKAPKWAMTAENDPVLFDCPPPSKEDIAMVDELLSEPDFLEMPREPKSKSVSSYLESRPQIVRMIVDAERWMIR